MKLSELLGEHGSEVSLEMEEVEITGLATDSRKVKEGMLFFALPGVEHNGAEFISAAIANGARGVVYSEPVEKEFGVIYLLVDDVQEVLTSMADHFYGHPSQSLQLYGVTGTNGKSTTACIIEDLLNTKEPPVPCGYSGTIAIRYGSVSIEPELTTPDLLSVQSTLRDMVDAGMQAASMEVSSHALAQHRVDGIDFDAAIFTNLTHDHLDYHKTMEAYLEAKALLFQNMKSTGLCVLNHDDPVYERLASVAQGRVVSYGMAEGADYRIVDPVLEPSRSLFTLVVSVDAQAHPVKPQVYRVETNLVAQFNLYNLVGALAALHGTGTPLEALLPRVRCIKQVAGRMEVIENDCGLNVIVDYAHTPDGYEKLFAFINCVREPNQRVLAVFGSAGRRDKTKRPVMGKLAAAECAHLYLTEEDCRDLETPEEIAHAIQGDLPDEQVSIIPDRYEAIVRAIDDAKSGDIVLLLGKGDEVFLDRATGPEPWMGDNEAARRALRIRAEREKKE